MENLKKLYAKDIEREIQGVIKVDDESYIGQELEEYVVTEELLKHFNSFFSAYNIGINTNTEKMGVWISGFFGSGKSHFLKIVSYLLENKVVNGKAAVDYFDDKIEDKMLLADIKRAGNISTDVILFNIDSKTENSNGTKDRILDVFEKVFNEKLGLSITPFVAEIERHIISQGKYEEFKKSFESKANSTWEEMRDGIQFVEDEFANAYAEVLNKSVEEARSIVERTEKNYTLSVEKFAERVRDYIKEKGYGDYFGHGLGHSVGIEIHENPRFSVAEEEIIKEGMVITVEPGIYLPNFGGVRIEDLIVVTKDGVKNLTHSPKSLIIID